MQWCKHSRGGRLLKRLAATGLVLVLASSLAQAISIDARRMATGGAAPPSADRLGGQNPAYTVVPDRYEEDGFNIPIPLGLPHLLWTDGKCA